MPELVELIQEQVQREKRASANAQSKALRELSEAVQQGRLEGLPASNRLMARLFQGMRDALSLVVNKTDRGPGAANRRWLRELEPEVLAVISIRVILSTCLQNLDKGATVQALGISIGRRIVREVLVRRAEEVSPVYVERTLHYLKTAGTVAQHHIDRTMDRVIFHVLELEAQDKMQHSDLLHMGKHCIQAAMAVGLLRMHRGMSSRGHLVTYHIEPEVQRVLTDFKPGMVQASRITSVCPPRPWHSAFGGGYQTADMGEPLLQLRYSNRPQTKRAVIQNIEENARLRDVVNYLQAVPYHIDPDAVDTLVDLWETGGAVLGMPSRSPQDKPPFPFPDHWDKEQASPQQQEQFQEWKRLTAAWYTRDKKRQSRLYETANLVRNARELKGRDVWFTMFLDFRQRLYYNGSPDPQGADADRSLVFFQKKKPLGKRGLFWLKVHIANSCGYDKTRFGDRAAWVDKHWEALSEGAQCPQDSDLYRGIGDNPLVAATAVRELQRAYDSGDPEKYCTGIPVHMDATCSGLQHFSAMLRDPIGAKYTNLIDPGTEEKADIYTRVAELALQQAERDAADSGHEYRVCAQLWKQYGIPRGLAKKPVMTYVYGATLRGVCDHVRDYLEEQGWEHPDISTTSMGQYLGRVLFDSVEAAVPAAAACMRWLRARCKQHSSTEPMTWLNPMGFLVSLDIRKMDETRVRLRSCGQSYVVVREFTDKNAGQRIGNSISPNFVHSLDAAHLCMVAERMLGAGLDMVAIHDSFGTHPSDVDQMHKFIREAFVELYTEYDPLVMFLEGIHQDVELPPRGNFELSHIMESEFFFC